MNWWENILAIVFILIIFISLIVLEHKWSIKNKELYPLSIPKRYKFFLLIFFLVFSTTILILFQDFLDGLGYETEYFNKEDKEYTIKEWIIFLSYLITSMLTYFLWKMIRIRYNIRKHYEFLQQKRKSN